MTLSASIGHSSAADAREAGKQAAAQALEGLSAAPAAGTRAHRPPAGRAAPVFAWLMASDAYPAADVLAGVAEVLGNLPLVGFSTSRELVASGRVRRSVVLALLGGTDVHARHGWGSDFAQHPRDCLQNVLRSLHPDPANGELLLLAADGISGGADLLAQDLSPLGFPVAGCLSGGEVWRGRTYQMSGRNSGSGGLAAAVLSGDIVVGQGAAHGWQPVGSLARITRVHQDWVRTIDDQPASEFYARLFGAPASAWARMPLNDLVRIYPLGVQEPEGLTLRSPLRMEADGSLRMNAAVAEGRRIEVMVGSPDRCRQAAGDAARQALQALGPTRPRLALVLADAAWHTLLELEPQAEVEAVRQVIGPNVPLCGGYTFGQLTRPRPDAPVSFLNQHLLVLLFGSRSVDAGDVIA